MRNLCANLGVVFASCLVGLFLCEVSLRLFYPKYRHLADAQFRWDTKRRWTRDPNVRNLTRHPDTLLRYPLRHNNLGLRQHRNFRAEDLNSAINVGVFGDSFVENVRMEVQYSLTEPLDFLLNQSGKRFNVLNFGMDGSGPGQSFLRYANFRYVKDLDFVVYLYYKNDLDDLSKRGLFALDAAGRLVENMPIRSSAWDRLISGLHLSYLVLDGSGRFRAKRKVNEGDLKQSAVIFRRLIRRWKQMVESNGGVFLVMTVPDAPIAPFLAAVLAEEGVEGIDLHDCFFGDLEPAHKDGAWPRSPYKFKNDGHWNEAGNQLAAVCLYRVLEEKMRLPALSEEDLQAVLHQYYAAFGGWTPMNAGGGQQTRLSAAAIGIREKYEPLGGLASIRKDLRKMVAAPGKQIIASDFDVYLDRWRLVYLKEGCSPTELKRPFFLNMIPVDENDLPEHRTQYGYVRYHKRLLSAIDQNHCIVSIALPHYPIHSLWTGQYDRNEGVVWEGEFAVGPDNSDEEEADFVPVAGKRIISSDFDVYLDGQHLAYVKKKCRPSDLQGPFFLHVTPVAADAPPPDRGQDGFDTLDFNACTIERRLPAYAIRHIRTGQYVKNADGRFHHLWNREFAIDPDERREGARFTPAAGTQIAASDFDVSLDGTHILYKKEHCRSADLDASFFLHVTPVNKSDLSRPGLSGFNNLGFSGRNSGFEINEFGCTKKRRLPAYAIRHIRTGQYVKDADGRRLHLWEGEFSLE